MSTTDSAAVEGPIAECRPADVEPVVIDGAELESTAPEYLRDLKGELSRRGYQPAGLDVTACFAEDCSLATQAEADRLRGLVRAAAFLGVGRIDVTVDEVEDPDRVEPALAALSERASREGVTFRVTGESTLAE
ncbi:hypothetical protein ACFQAS_05485 [Halopenitus salinus]|uniref:DUF7961 domain-containing protein n=1 Tax=Halopenitus salinus TaxID=1198295 RepID=A0ABD5UWD9_9EURY